MKNLPLNLGRFDHYTLIVPNAEECTRFHIEVLGFEWVRKQLVNAGSAPEGKYDMLNHLLHLPGDKSRTLVITEGLTDNSIFRKYHERQHKTFSIIWRIMMSQTFPLKIVHAAIIMTTIERQLN